MTESDLVNGILAVKREWRAAGEGGQGTPRMKSSAVRTYEDTVYRFDVFADGAVNISWGENYSQGIGLDAKDVQHLEELLHEKTPSGTGGEGGRGDRPGTLHTPPVLSKFAEEVLRTRGLYADLHQRLREQP